MFIMDKSQKQEHHSGFQGLKNGGNGELLFNRCKVLIMLDEQVLEISHTI